MNQFLSTFNLPFITELLTERQQDIIIQINNLKLKDVEDDAAFAATRSRIKKDILLNPIKFGSPVYRDHNYSRKPVTMERQMLGVGPDNYTHIIAFPFSGDEELFDYRPVSGLNYRGSDHGLIRPGQNDEVLVEVDLDKLAPDQAIKAAEPLFRLTKSVVEGNSTSVTTWNAQMEIEIDSRLNVKRDELIRLFGKK